MIRRARAICIQSKLSSALWCELVKTTCYLLNRTPRYRLGNKTPFEIVFKKQPDVSHIRSIGCKAYYLLKGSRAPSKLEKLSPRESMSYLIGYDGGNKFRIWNPIRNVIVVTRDVTFDESSTYDPKSTHLDPQLIRNESIFQLIDQSSLKNPESYQQRDTELYDDNVGT